jgi:p-aminobenzoyl-glutamate transporter AbgT
VEPRMGKWDGNDYAPKIDLETYRLTDVENLAEKTGIFLLIVIAVLVLASVPSWSFLRTVEGDSIF